MANKAGKLCLLRKQEPRDTSAEKSARPSASGGSLFMEPLHQVWRAAVAIGLGSGPETAAVQVDRPTSESDEPETSVRVGAKRICWTVEEDETILRAVERHGNKWDQVAAMLKMRTADGVRNRWQRIRSHMQTRIRPGAREPQELVTSPDGTAPGWVGFSDQEDAIVIDGVRRLGMRWRKIAELLPGRSESAVRNRHARLVETHGINNGNASLGTKAARSAARAAAAAAAAALVTEHPPLIKAKLLPVPEVPEGFAPSAPLGTVPCPGQSASAMFPFPGGTCNGTASSTALGPLQNLPGASAQMYGAQHRISLPASAAYGAQHGAASAIRAGSAGPFPSTLPLPCQQTCQSGVAGCMPGAVQQAHELQAHALQAQAVRVAPPAPADTRSLAPRAAGLLRSATATVVTQFAPMLVYAPHLPPGSVPAAPGMPPGWVLVPPAGPPPLRYPGFPYAPPQLQGHHIYAPQLLQHPYPPPPPPPALEPLTSAAGATAAVRNAAKAEEVAHATAAFFDARGNLSKPLTPSTAFPAFPAFAAAAPHGLDAPVAPSSVAPLAPVPLDPASVATTATASHIGASVPDASVPAAVPAVPAVSAAVLTIPDVPDAPDVPAVPDVPDASASAHANDPATPEELLIDSFVSWECGHLPGSSTQALLSAIQEQGDALVAAVSSAAAASSAAAGSSEAGVGGSHEAAPPDATLLPCSPPVSPPAPLAPPSPQRRSQPPLPLSVWGSYCHLLPILLLVATQAGVRAYSVLTQPPLAVAITAGSPDVRLVASDAVNSPASTNATAGSEVGSEGGEGVKVVLVLFPLLLASALVLIALLFSARAGASPRARMRLATRAGRYRHVARNPKRPRLSHAASVRIAMASAPPPRPAAKPAA